MRGMAQKTTHRYFLPIWQVNGLILLVIAGVVFMHNHLHLSIEIATLYSFFQVGLCLIFILGLRYFYQRLQGTMHFGARTAALIIGLCLIASLMQSLVSHGVTTTLGWKEHPFWSPTDLWLLRLLFFWLAYMSWSLLFFWIRAEKSSHSHAQKSAEARMEAQRMELQLLRRQLDPHFLFNALNGVATVVQADSPSAAEVVRELADYLRYSLDRRYDTAVPLEEEIQAAMAYLRIEQARFDEELHVEITTDDWARSRGVPCFILLPLVENAVKHSFQMCEPPWHVGIVAEAEAGTLRIEVSNSGQIHAAPDTTGGAGLDILRRRLELHYPGRHQFQLEQRGDRVCASLLLEGDPCFV
jgi:two-component system, LytTR family, sensor kinase